MTELYEKTAVELAAAIDNGRLTAEAVTIAHLERVKAREPLINAWEHLAAEAALRRARALDRGPRRGPLHGIPLGVKDIMDTADLPTAYGSEIYKGVRPSWDASCVALARASGGVVIGKTVTTEFAYFRPGPTANPHNPHHTPGGSSSGSAAAVADFMVPIAFGSQTAGSLTRPASYCGVFGYKPTYGRHSLAGVKGLAQSLDTLGWIARSADDLALARAALTGETFKAIDDRFSTAPRMGICHTYEWSHAEPATVAALDAAEHILERAGARVSLVELPPAFAKLSSTQKTIMAYEATRALAYERENHIAFLSPSLRKLLEDGAAISYQDYVGCLDLAGGCRTQLADLFDAFDVLLAPSSPGEAPLGLAATGDPVFSRIWTLLHVPSITVPGFIGASGLPVGIQLIGRLDCDAQLLSVAKWAAKLIAA